MSNFGCVYLFDLFVWNRNMSTYGCLCSLAVQEASDVWRKRERKRKKIFRREIWLGKGEKKANSQGRGKMEQFFADFPTFSSLYSQMRTTTRTTAKRTATATPPPLPRSPCSARGARLAAIRKKRRRRRTAPAMTASSSAPSPPWTSSSPT